MNPPEELPDARRPDALDRRIDAALARHFAPPASLATLAARARPDERPHPDGRRGARPEVWTLLALAAALVLAILALRGRPSEAPRAPRVPALVASQPGTPPDATLETPAFCSVVGPLLEGQTSWGAPATPDLARLYRAMDDCQRVSSTACGEGDRLGERLGATYGEALQLSPAAAGLLHGPFGSSEWPTATIMTATQGELTTVLVADRGSTLDCCVRPQLDARSGLNLFSLSIGDVVLTEISPLAEPRLLAFFR